MKSLASSVWPATAAAVALGVTTSANAQRGARPPATAPIAPYTQPATAATAPYTQPPTVPTTPYTQPPTVPTTPYTQPPTAPTVPMPPGSAPTAPMPPETAPGAPAPPGTPPTVTQPGTSRNQGDVDADAPTKAMPIPQAPSKVTPSA